MRPFRHKMWLLEIMLNWAEFWIPLGFLKHMFLTKIGYYDSKSFSFLPISFHRKMTQHMGMFGGKQFTRACLPLSVFPCASHNSERIHKVGYQLNKLEREGYHFLSTNLSWLANPTSLKDKKLWLLSPRHKVQWEGKSTGVPWLSCQDWYGKGYGFPRYPQKQMSKF